MKLPVPGGRSFFGQLLRSHLLVGGIGTLGLLFCVFAVAHQKSTVETLLERSLPLEHAGERLVLGIQRSDWALKGWILLGNRAYRDEWSSAWREDIEPSMAFLSSVNEGDGKVLGLPSHLPSLLADLREIQWWVQKVAHTPGNEPSRALYVDRVRPIAREVERTLGTLSALVEAGGAMPGPQVLAEIGQAERAFARCRLLLERIVNAGVVFYEGEFNDTLERTKKSVALIAGGVELQQHSVRKTFHELRRDLDAFGVLAGQAVAARKSPGWNVALQMMKEESAPLSEEILGRSTEFSQRVHEKMQRSSVTATRVAAGTGWFLGAIALGVVAAAIMVSRNRAGALAARISALSRSTRELAESRHGTSVPVSGDDELSELARAFNGMRSALDEARVKLVKNERLAVLGQITATVAHELRNPLGTIRISVFHLERKIGAAAGVEHVVNRINRNIDRCDRIVRELLDYTRELVLDLEETPIDLWLEEVLGELAESRSFVREARLHAGVNLALDRERMRRCIINIVDNAIDALEAAARQGDATPGGEEPRQRRIVVETALAGDRLKISFTDNGCGMTEAAAARALEPLFSTKNFGVGLGLPTVQRIMEQHGGTLDIASEPGRGTTVTLWLPLGPAEARPMPRQRQPAKGT